MQEEESEKEKVGDTENDEPAHFIDNAVDHIESIKVRHNFENRQNEV